MFGMDENKVIKAKNDRRVNFNYLIDERINALSAISDEHMNKIVIYCHGLGSNKTWAIKFYENLLNENIGIVSFDFPGHGEDNTDFSDFDLSLCITYLDRVIQYVKDKYNVPIYLFGCSFGGFVILNKIIQNNNIEKTMLMCPAVNFCEILEIKADVSSNYFIDNTFLPLYNNIKIYKKAYLEFKKGEENIKKFAFKNVSIIQGTKDKTVLYDNIKDFCLKNNLELTTIDNGKHELYGYDDEIVRFLLKNINK